MAVNARRGEVAAMLDGREYRLCLTLGALAELEDAFAAEDLGALVERFSAGRLSAGDMVRVIGAGLRGGGNAIDDDEVRAMRSEDGAAGFARIVSDLLTATFGGAGGRFPFVDGLRQLAGECRAILGSGTTITYGADWSEYFGHQPQDGSGDVLFHLDPLWADAAVDAVGIDNYMPLSDWRDADYAGGNPDGFRGPYDAEGLRTSIASGEGFDWYYASAEDRIARLRSPISDGAHGKDWVFRYKDIDGWWSNPHHERHGGVEDAQPTAWVPRSKPVLFTELGCGAVDKGPNQPNVFPDPKTSENSLPYFSNGGRSDLAQSRFWRRIWSTGKRQAVRKTRFPTSMTARCSTLRAYTYGLGTRGPFRLFRSMETPGGTGPIGN